MSQTITIPFNDQEIGQGFNLETRENVGTALVMASISEDPLASGQVVRTFFNTVTTQESLMKSLGVSTSTDVRYGLYSGGAKLDFAESNSVNSFSSFIAGRCEVHNAMQHGHSPRLTPEAAALVAAGDQEGFKTAFGNMYVRSLKTGGEFCVVARITSVSEEHQNKLTTSLHGEYNGLSAAGSFKAAFDTAMKETSSQTEVVVFTSQAGGVGGQTSFTGPDAAKILERLSQFPQSAHDHPVGYEVELATYDTIPLPIPAPEEHEDRNIVLADCLSQKMGFLKKLSDLQFALGPSGAVFFEDLPKPAELAEIEKQYREALNGLMAHAIKVATGNMRPPQMYTAAPVPPPITFKKKPVSSDDKANFANSGLAIANTDSLVAAFRELQPVGTRRQGFDIGMGVTEGDTLWGPGKQRLLDSLAFDEQTGFRQAATFAMIRNNNAALAAAGANIADADGEVETARKAEASGLYWLGFDIGTGIFGDPARGALGNTAVGPGSGKIRSGLTTVEHVLLISHQAERGFDAAVAFHLGRKH